MTVLSHDRLIESANALPPLPDTFIRLQELFSDPDYEMRDVIRAVELDPVLTGKALKLANSAAYGSGGINTTQQAVGRLGSGTVAALAISAAVQPPADIDLSAFGLTPHSYWLHSVTVLAFAEELIARRIGHVSNELLTASLIHDFGKLILAPQMTPEHVAEIGRTDPHAREFERETIVLSVHHAEMTAIIAQSWGLSEQVVRAVQYHHNPGEIDGNAMAHALNIANQLAWRLEGCTADLDREASSLVESVAAIHMEEAQLDGLLKSGSDRLFEIQESYS